MEIIVPNIPQMNVKELKLAPKCTTVDGETLTGMSRNTSIRSFRSMFGTWTNSDHSVERKIKYSLDLDKYFSVPKSIKNLLHQKKIDIRVIN